MSAKIRKESFYKIISCYEYAQTQLFIKSYFDATLAIYKRGLTEQGKSKVRARYE